MTDSETYYPQYMNMNSQDMIKSAISKRNKFDQLIEKIELQRVVDQKLKDLKENYLIVGSRSWNRWLSEKQINVPEQNKTAFLSGNYDLFVFTNEIQNTIHTMYKLFLEIKEELQFSAQEDVYLELELNGFKVDNKSNIKILNEVETILYPGYELLLYLYPYDHRQKRRKQIENFSEKDKSLAVYCKIFHSVKYIDLNSIATIDQYTNVRYTNEVGLFIFMTLLRSQRTEKGINVDQIRHNTLLGSLDISLSNVYKYTVKAYCHIFLGSKFYDEFVFNQLQLEILKNQDIITQSYLIEINNWLINKFRIYVNSFLVYVNEEIKKNKLDAQIFLVGGDAMKRHKRTISKTADFDTKVYCTKSNKDNVEKIVRTGCTKLIDLMSRSLKDIVSDHIHLNDLVFTLRSGTNLQFRLRKIKEHENFNFDLISVDYRYYIKQNTNRFKIDLAFLDVVFQTIQTKKQLEKDNIVYLNEIPVASLKFLIDDMKNTYSSKELAMMRYFNGKHKKDLKRYKILNNIKDQKIFNTSYKNDLNETSNEIINILSKDLSQLQSKYLKTFDTIIKSDRSKIKHKMKYNLTLS